MTLVEIPADPRPHLEPGALLTAIDAEGREHCVVYQVLANAGGGNGVLVAFDLSDWGMPRLLAFGDVVYGPAGGGERIGYHWWRFRSYTRCDPTLRGRPYPGSPGCELVELRARL